MAMTTRGVPAAAVVVLASALAGGVMGTRAGATQQDMSRIEARYGMYQVALAAIEKDYVEKVDSAQLVYGSMACCTRSIRTPRSSAPRTTSASAS